MCSSWRAVGLFCTYMDCTYECVCVFECIQYWFCTCKLVSFIVHQVSFCTCRGVCDIMYAGVLSCVFVCVDAQNVKMCACVSVSVCVCSSLVSYKRAHGSMGNESLLAPAMSWSKLQWQKTISCAAGLHSLTDLEDAGSKTLPLPTVYPFIATAV